MILRTVELSKKLNIWNWPICWPKWRKCNITFLRGLSTLRQELNTFLRGLSTLRPELSTFWSERDIQLRIRDDISLTCRILHRTSFFVNPVMILNINFLRKKDKGMVFLRKEDNGVIFFQCYSGFHAYR